MSLNGKFKLLIVGAGGVGGLFGYCISKSPLTNVTLVCRSNYNQVKLNGFNIKSCTWGDQVYYPDNVVGSIEEANELHDFYDYVIITTKTHNSESLAKSLKSVISPKTCIVLIQNGLNLEEPYINQYPNNSLISVITIVGVHQLESGFLEHYLPFKMNFGNGRHLENTYLPQDNQHISNFESIIVNSDINYQLTDEMKFVSWHKVQFLGTLGVISVLSGGLTIQEILSNSYTRQLVDDAINEVSGLAKKVLGKNSPSWLPTVEMHHKMMLNNPLPYKPSILIDFEKGNAMEFESTLGNVVRIAQEYNHPIPICKSNYTLLKAIDFKNVMGNRA